MLINYIELHLCCSSFHVFRSPLKDVRAKSYHISQACCNELQLLFCSVSATALYISHHKKPLTLTMRQMHPFPYNIFMMQHHWWLKCHNGYTIRKHLFNTMEKQPFVIKDIFVTNAAQVFGCNYKANRLFAYEWGFLYICKGWKKIYMWQGKGMWKTSPSSLITICSEKQWWLFFFCISCSKLIWLLRKP